MMPALSGTFSQAIFLKLPPDTQICSNVLAKSAAKFSSASNVKFLRTVNLPFHKQLNCDSSVCCNLLAA